MPAYARTRFLARSIFVLLILFVFAPSASLPLHSQGSQLPNPILFVTQFPIAADFTTIGSVFGNHRASMDSVARGGDLWIRYPNGTQKNLTAAAGYGVAGMQGATAIAVRDPSVHWDGTKALFSMVIGAPTKQYEVLTFYWQMYEITGLGQNETPVITKVPNQPVNYNNISPIYGTDDRIIFTTDRPRNGDPNWTNTKKRRRSAVCGVWTQPAAISSCSTRPLPGILRPVLTATGG